MASFRATVLTPWTLEAAFDFMADASNFERWDPGIISSTRIDDGSPHAGSEFDIRVRSIGGSLVLRYRITRLERPGPDSTGVVVLEARHPKLTSTDRIDVSAAEIGSIVTYHADLSLNGVWRLFSPLMAIGFRRIGERGAEGLVRALDGERVAA